MQWFSTSNFRKLATFGTESFTDWRTRRTRPKTSLFQRFAPYYTLVFLLAVWQAVASFELIPAFLIPAPRAIFDQFIEVVRDGRLWLHTLSLIHI